MMIIIGLENVSSIQSNTIMQYIMYGRYMMYVHCMHNVDLTNVLTDNIMIYAQVLSHRLVKIFYAQLFRPYLSL